MVANQDTENGLKRRYTDHVEKADDHELLLKLHAKLDIKLATICAAVTAQKEEIRQLSKTMNERCDRRYTTLSNASFDRSTLLKVVLVIIAGFCSVFVLSGSNTRDIRINAKDIKHHILDCEKSGIIFKDVVKELEDRIDNKNEENE